MSIDQPKPPSPQEVESICSPESQLSDSPMNWSWLRKHIILVQCAFYALSPGFTSSILIPGSNDVAQQFGITSQKAIYLIAVHVLFLGLAPFFWIPCIKVFGRRPVLIASVFLSCVAALGGGFAKTYGTLMTARVFQSFGVSTGFILPGIIIVDLFKAEERGRKNGVWTQMVSIGAPLGGVIGGPLVYYEGWKWVLWLTAIMNGVQTIGFALTCPETSYWHRQNGWGQFHFGDLIEPFIVLQAPHIVFIAFAYGVSFAIVSVGLAAIVPIALEEIYGFSAVSQGLFFLGPLVGALIGEQLAGPASDWIMNRGRQTVMPGASKPKSLESRLLVGLPGFVFAIGGILIFGLTLQNKTHWMGPCMGFAIANFGLQVITTPLKTYCVDCLPAHSGSVLQLMNAIRQIISFTVPFWSPNLSAKLGYSLGYGVEAIILAFFSVGSLVVLWRGAIWRNDIPVKWLRD